ncbi:hypothetical protein [Pseudomonas syringae]|uniref:hypothetical protein n=1 Tax=Pseudomonas syringae TaxID=317 RepID=UPI00128EE308|nr:hypothetical protein [Pseudomonas syringae]
MSIRLTTDELNDVINETMKSSVRYNAEQQCNVIDGGFGGADQGFYSRYTEDKERIIKAAGIDASRIKPEDNIENILIGKEIVSAVRNNDSLFKFARHVQNGHLSIDVSTPTTTVKFSDEIAKYSGTAIALEFSKAVCSNGVKTLNFNVPALEESGERPTLVTALKATAEYVTDVLDTLKNKTELKAEEKPSVKAKLKM